MDDGYGITFTPDQDLDKTGENENKKSTSTTAFRTEKNTTFTVSVGEGFYFKSVTFKEDGTEKASSSNIAPNSTSISVSVPKNKFFNYITVVLTVDAYTVSVPENLTISDAFATINRVKYYKSGETVTLTAKENEIINTITGVTASNENVTINLAADRKTATFKMPSEDVTITATTTEVHTVSVPDGITLSDAFINISGTDYYKAGETVTFGFSGSGSVVYFVNGERIEGNSVTVGKKDLKVEIGIPYIDENGKTQIREPGEYTVLTSLTDVSNLGGGWYVVQGKVKYASQVKFSGDAHLILADGAEMVIESKTYGIQADKNLTIYGQNGQSDQSGTLKVTATGLYGINSEKGNITISGGSVTASGSNCGIYSSEGVTINGGIVTASGYYGIYNNRGNITINGGIVTATGYNSIYNDYGNITISGGSVTATGTSNGLYGPNGVTINGGSVTATGINGYGIYSQDRDITLGWTNSTDFIKASSYKGSVQIAEGKLFKDEKGNVYSGMLTGEQLSAIKSKKLEPCYVVTFDAQNGDGPIMLPATFDENGVAYVKKPNDPIRSGFTFEGWFTATDGNTEFDFSAAITGNTTAYAKWSVPYIDEKGKPQIRKPGEYTVLTSLTDVSNLGGGWYVVQGKVEYTNQVKFSGDAHLILADGAEMVIKSETYGIQADKNLTIYGQSKQSDQSGTLKVTATGSGIYSRGNITIIGGTVEATGKDYGIYGYNEVTINGGTVSATGTSFYGIYSYSGDITISGGKVEASGSCYGIYSKKNVTIIGGSVTATSDYGYGIYSYSGDITISGGKVEASGKDYGIYSKKNVTISGGSVTATGKNGYGIFSDNGGVTISGGSVTATGNYYGINSNSDITLGWTNSTDNIKASSYYSYKGSVQIAEGKSFKDENGNVYRGSLTGEQLSAIKGKKLEPCYAVTFDAQNGDDPIMLLTSFDENGVAHVKKPNDPIRSGFTFEGWFAAPEGGSEFDFTKAVTGNTTAYAHWNENTPVEYIDENGGTNETKNYILLTNGIKVDNLPGGWYVVQGEVKYASQVKFEDDAHLILADGAEMVIESETYGIQADKNLTIYGQNGQSDQSGTLKVTATSSGIYSKSGDITIIGGTVTDTSTSANGIYSNSGDITIIGGSVTATGTNGIGGIYCKSGDITIIGGSVTATGSSYGIYGYNGVTINGGTVEATGDGSGIYGYKGNITLGWTNSTDFIYASSYSLGDNEKHVSIVEGKSFKDDKDNVYSGPLTGEQLSAIKGKKLEPAKPFPDNMVIADIPDQIYTGDSICPMADVTMPAGVDPLVKGEDYKVVCKENLNAGTATLSVQGVGIYYGEIKKTFTIAKASLTVTAKDKTIVYGDEPTNDGVKYSGFVGEENEAVLGGELSYSYNYQKLDKVGEYTITPSGLTASNYEITYAAGTLTVEIAAVSVEAPVAKEKLVYSGKSQELVTAGKTNFGTLLYSLDGEKYSAEIPTATDAKTYTVYYKVAESDNWNAFEAKIIEVVIAKAPLTITAKDKTIAYGDEPANDGVEYSGFIGEENASVLGGKLTYSYDYKKLDKVGKYTITPSGLTAGNYEISFVAGALNVEPKATHYAAVQVLEDENGKRAEIDGEYGEGDGIVITEPLEVASVEFSRVFSTQGYSTIVLPFDVNTSKLSGVDSVLSFARIVKEQGEMAVGMKVVWEASASHVDLKANTPYMVKMTGAKLGIDGSVTLLPTEAAVTKSDAQNDGWEFRGTYAYKSWQEGDEDLCRVYGFAGGSNDEVSEGDFVKFTAGASLRPLRAYLINTNRTCGAPKMARAYGDYVLGAKSSIDDLPESMKVVIVGEDGYTTVIGHFNTRTGEFTTGTSVRKFDLKGRAVRGTPSARGAYYGKRVKK